MNIKNASEVMAVCEKTTPGPWEIAGCNGQLTGIDGPFGYNHEMNAVIPQLEVWGTADADFIAMSREALPYYVQRTLLLEEVLQDAMEAMVQSNLTGSEIIGNINKQVPDLNSIEGSDYVMVKQSELAALRETTKQHKLLR